VVFLDTDVVVDLLRRLPAAIEWFENLNDEEIALSGFVVMELIQGCRARREVEIVEKTVRRMEIIWPTEDDCNEALKVYAENRLKHGIGFLDVLIGQTAVYLGLPLYTFNQKHYKAVSQLKTVQPYKR